MTRALEKVLRRERVVVFGALAALIILAWSYLIWLSWIMSSAMSDSMPGMAEMQMPQMLRPWTAAEFSTVFAMWSVMMVGMMTPSIAPAILTYVRVSRHPVTRQAPLAPIGWFVGGYLLAWLGFALIASAAQAALLEADLITPMLRSSSELFGGIVFILAGGYQLTMLKDTCLSLCQSPVSFINDQGGFKPSAIAALKLGLRHGFYCVGCCWAMMVILFAVGVMELIWIAVISIWALLEKIFPVRGTMTQVSGVTLVVVGILLLARTGL